MKPYIVIVLAIAAIAIAENAHGATTEDVGAAQVPSSRELTSTDAKAPIHTETYKFQDGYGEYTGHGATKIAAQSEAREKCIENQVAGYEARHGVTPDADTADLFIDACINK